LKESEENLQDIFNLLTASYVVGVTLMACLTAALKATGAAAGSSSSSARHGTECYSVLPDPAEGGVLAAGPSSTELCLLTVQSDAPDDQPHSAA
jgi:hypothetical protein